MNTRYGEMLDMISCMAINNGAKPKETKRKRKDLSFDQIFDLR